MRSQSPFDLASFLQSVPLLSGLETRTLDILAQACRHIELSQGQLLFSQDEQADAAYLVHSGAISIILMTPDGRELVINEMRPGEFFGEIALLDGGRRTASAIARVPSLVVALPRGEFHRLFESQPRLARHLAQVLAARLSASTERESAFAFLDAPARLARALLELDRAARAEGYVTMSQEEISQHIGIARQTAAKILGDWRRRGWIITGRGRIVVLDRSALRKVTDSTSPIPSKPAL